MVFAGDHFVAFCKECITESLGTFNLFGGGGVDSLVVHDVCQYYFCVQKDVGWLCIVTRAFAFSVSIMGASHIISSRSYITTDRTMINWNLPISAYSETLTKDCFLEI